MQAQSSELARKLVSGAYGDFFVVPGHDETIDRVWNVPGNPGALEVLVSDVSEPVKARFFACEVLFAREFTFVSRVSAATVAEIYARALVGNLTGKANSWGLLYEHDDPGPVGIRFIMLGEAAVPALVPLLDDTSTSLLYEGSKEATVGNGYRYRIKDFAAFYLGRIRRIPVRFHREWAEREREIEKLKEALAASR